MYGLGVHITQLPAECFFWHRAVFLVRVAQSRPETNLFALSDLMYQKQLRSYLVVVGIDTEKKGKVRVRERQHWH